MSDDIVERLRRRMAWWKDDCEDLRESADEITRLRAELTAVTAERDALTARLAPVEDEKLTEIVARAICLNRAAHACNCKENGVCKAPLENLREYNEVWPQARAAIAAATRSRGSE